LKNGLHPALGAGMKELNNDPGETTRNQVQEKRRRNTVVPWVRTEGESWSPQLL